MLAYAAIPNESSHPHRRELPPLTAAEVSYARVPGIGLASLSLSPDERVLAVAPVAGGAVSLFTVHSLVESGTPLQPFATWQLPLGNRALQVTSSWLFEGCWRPRECFLRCAVSSATVSKPCPSKDASDTAAAL